MVIRLGYMRVSSDSDRQSTDLQRDALLAAGVDARHLFEDHASGTKDDRTGLLGRLNSSDLAMCSWSGSLIALAARFRTRSYCVSAPNTWNSNSPDAVVSLPPPRSYATPLPLPNNSGSRVTHNDVLHC